MAKVCEYCGEPLETCGIMEVEPQGDDAVFATVSMYCPKEGCENFGENVITEINGTIVWEEDF